MVGQAALELGDKDVQDHEPDHDWTARFFNDVQDVSSEEMQLLWAKVLAGEVERPGSTSIKTLGIPKNLDKATATLFRTARSMSMSLRPDGNTSIVALVHSLGSNAGQNALQKYGLAFDDLNVLNEHGIIISDYNSWRDFQVSIGFSLSGNTIVQIPFHFLGRYWTLNSTVPRDTGKEFRLSGVAFTKSGQELMKIVDFVAADQFAADLAKYFIRDNLDMMEVGDWRPQPMSTKSP